jgi:hypothetical protein
MFGASDSGYCGNNHDRLTPVVITLTQIAFSESQLGVKLASVLFYVAKNRTDTNFPLFSRSLGRKREFGTNHRIVIERRGAKPRIMN